MLLVLSSFFSAAESLVRAMTQAKPLQIMITLPYYCKSTKLTFWRMLRKNARSSSITHTRVLLVIIYLF
jgi:hypothetical protein